MAPRRRQSGPVTGIGLEREGWSRSGSVGARESQPGSRSLRGKAAVTIRLRLASGGLVMGLELNAISFSQKPHGEGEKRLLALGDLYSIPGRS